MVFSPEPETPWGQRGGEMRSVVAWWLGHGGLALALALGLIHCGWGTQPSDPPAPAISAFKVAPEAVTDGGSASLMATFSHGTGTVDHGVGPVSSGVAALVSPQADTTYTLTVVNSASVCTTATLTLRVVPPARILAFAPAAVTVAPGEGTTLTALFENGVGVLDHGLGACPSGGPGVSTGPLSTSTSFTLTVTNELGDTVRATALVTVLGTPSMVSTGSLLQPRHRHTATLLSDGRVLIVGGMGDAFVHQRTAELYDPGPGTAVLTGAPLSSRIGHTATLLRNGQVLIAGGDPGGSPPMGEVYDPATGTFRPSGVMTASRYLAAAALLPDGRVLLAGGIDTRTNEIHRSAEVYDPQTGTFRAVAGVLASPRFGDAAIPGPGGRILLVGGGVQAGDLSVEEYDPATDLFLPKGSLLTARVLATATRLPDGRVLVLGGATPRAPLEHLGSAEVYDPLLGTCAMAPWYPGTLRAGHTATLLPDSTVLVAGGFAPSGQLDDVDLFDVSSNTLRPPKASLSTHRSGHTATLLPEGRVLLSGGHGEAGVLASQELYVPWQEPPGP